MTKIIIFSAVLLIAALFVRSEVISIVAMMLGGAALLSNWWLGRIERRLRIGRAVPTHLTYGQDASVTVTIENHSLVRVPWLLVRESIAYSLRVQDVQQTVITLGAGARHQVVYPIRGSRRGWYSVGPLQLVLGDVLGLRRARLSVPATFVTVYPRVLPLIDLGLPAELSYGPLRPRGVRQRVEDPARPVGVRQYVPGDDVRRLDWKSSARQTTLLVRRADPTIAPETTIALAFGRDDYPAQVLQDALERAVTVAASFSVALLARKLPVSLVSNGLDPQHNIDTITLPFGKGDGQRQTILGVLGRLSLGQHSDLLIMLHHQQLPWGGTLILIMADLTLDRLPHLAALQRRGQQLALILVEASTGGLALAQQQHITAYTVDRRGIAVQVRGA